MILTLEQERFIAEARRCAMMGIFDGLPETSWLMRYCLHVVDWGGFPVSALFTRDAGHHTCGWWKNPDYERCWHLSCSFKDGFTRPRGDSLARAFFGNDATMTWLEPPYSAGGKAMEVWHYRLFCDPGWNPIKPEGEVYSKRMPKNWLSFSELRAA